MIPDSALAKLPPSIRKAVLDARAEREREYAAKFTSGPPLHAFQKAYNHALEDLRDAADSHESVARNCGPGHGTYKLTARRFAETKAKAQGLGEKCERELLHRPLTDGEWTKGFEDPYPDER